MNIKEAFIAIASVASEYSGYKLKLIFDGNFFLLMEEDMTSVMFFEAYDIEEKGLSFQTLKPIANKVYSDFLKAIKEYSLFNIENYMDQFDQFEIEDEIRAELKQCQWAKETLGELLKD